MAVVAAAPTTVGCKHIGHDAALLVMAVFVVVAHDDDSVAGVAMAVVVVAFVAAGRKGV